MAVRNIECQIAGAQIGRYLNGDTFSPYALAQLEDHVGECADCRQMLLERQENLLSMLGKVSEAPAPKTAAVDVSNIESARWKVALDSAKAVAELPEQEPAKVQQVRPQLNTKQLGKPMAYAGALAVVLIGMNLGSRYMNSTLDSRGIKLGSETTPVQPKHTEPLKVLSTSSAIAPQEKPSTTNSTTTPSTTKPAPANLAAQTSPIEHEKPKPDRRPAPTLSGQPQPKPIIAKHPAIKRGPAVALRAHAARPRRLVRKAPATLTSKPKTKPVSHAPKSIIRVYDSQGQRISPIGNNHA